MAERDGQRGSGVSGAIRPGTLSALLQEIAAAPDAVGGAWEAVLRPGASVGKFELVRELGRGGFGVVWEARDGELGRSVAFKAVRAGGKTGLREERLLLEAEAAARLSHPNIVTLFDVGRAEPGPYLVLELLHGETLSERLARGPLPVPEAVRIAVEVARGLSHAHAHGVVHRDLKPENVFVCEDGQVKVLDFGLAHAFGQRRADGGTSGYMAPEQAEGAPEDERTDVFALGVVLFEMLAARRPFPDEKALRGTAPAPALEVPGEPALGELVARMLSKKPAERPRDGGEVLRALAAFLREIERAGANAAGPVRMRRRPGLRLALLAASTALGLGIAAAVAWWATSSSHPRTGSVASSPSDPGSVAVLPLANPSGDFPSIAVLPFADMSPGKDQEYFADGVAEEILSALSQVDGLRVTGRTSSFSFKGKRDSVAEIGRKLSVATVLEGSVRKAGSRVRVTAQLVNAADGFRVWSQTFDRKLDDVFAVQEEIARAVVRALHVRLLADREPSTRDLRTASAPAYEQLLRGRGLYDLGTVPALQQAVEALEGSLALDPGYAPAMAWLSTSLSLLEAIENPIADPARRVRSRDLADRAIALAPGLAEAYWARAYGRILYFWDWTGAMGDLDRALVLRPGFARALSLRALLLAALGRLPEAIQVSRRASESDPLVPGIWQNLASLYNATGQLGRAHQAIDRGLEVSPAHFLALRERGFTLLLEGRREEALALFEKHPSAYMRLTGMALAQHDLGRPRESQNALASLIGEYGGPAAYQVAQVYAWIGDADHAFEWLDRSHATRDPGTRYVKYDPFMRHLRGDPRYPAFLRKMNLPVE